ncbi:MAG: bifunctional UDP-sugar hydrolase/5'-nucleotidase [Elusimicrobiota bacterium]|jgi:2',3'-cyclic-nucleotide 2'-phosphodiesterase (5'-nucleotidase family)
MNTLRRSRKLSALIGVLFFFAARCGAENLRVQVFHTNDIHGGLMAHPASFYKPDPHRLIGGAAALSSALKKLSEPGVPRLLLDPGDWFQGTPEGNFTKGRSMAEFFDLLGYDAVGVGNHEYDYGEAHLQDLVSQMKTPVTSANVLMTSGERVPYLRPYVLTEKGGVKVGIFGLLTTAMPALSFSRNFAGRTAADEIVYARKAVAELKAAGAEVIILLSHVGYGELDKKPFQDDKAIAAAVPGIDLIVGGHSHSALENGFREPVHGTLIVQSGSGLSRVGRVVLEIDPKTHKVVRSEAGLRDLWVDEFGEDPAVAAMVGKYHEEVGRTLDVVIGTSSVVLSRERFSESSMGDWMTDCERRYSKTQLAFQNSGGIRADISPGPVTLRSIFEAMPFDNAVVLLNLTGRQVREVLEHSISGDRGLLQASGLRLSYDASAPAGRRLKEVFVGDRPLRDEDVYSVTAADFVVGGGDGYSIFSQGTDKVFTPILVRDVLEWCVRNTSPLTAPVMGRVRKL